MAGVKSCKKCGGRGYTEVLSVDPRQLPEFNECDCTEKLAIHRNLEKGWRGLTRAKNILSSPLSGLTHQNLRLTVLPEVFRSHLRRVGINKGRNWNFRVVTDADLVRAWLSNVSEGPRGMMSADGEWVPLDHYSHTPLIDLIAPPSLLIICLWEQIAKNSQMPNVLSQVILQRDHNGQPTWVVDTMLMPFREGHRCYSAESYTVLSTWGHYSIEDLEENDEEEIESIPTPSRRPPKVKETSKTAVLEDEIPYYKEEFTGIGQPRSQKKPFSQGWSGKKKT